MTKPISQSTFYIATPTLNKAELDQIQSKAERLTRLTNVNTTKNQLINFTVSNISEGKTTSKSASLEKKHVRFQNPIESGSTPPPLPPRAPRINNPAIQASSPPPVFSKDMSDDALKNILKKPGDFQFDRTGSSPHLIHHSSDGSIIRTPVQTDQNGQLHIYKKGWDIINNARPANLEDLAQGLQRVQKMKLVELGNSITR